MKKQLLEAIKKAAEDINKIDPTFYGKFAIRKAEAVNENTSLDALVRVADDLVLIASKVNS